MICRNCTCTKQYNQVTYIPTPKNFKSLQTLKHLNHKNSKTPSTLNSKTPKPGNTIAIFIINSELRPQSYRNVPSQSTISVINAAGLRICNLHHRQRWDSRPRSLIGCNRIDRRSSRQLKRTTDPH